MSCSRASRSPCFARMSSARQASLLRTFNSAVFTPQISTFPSIKIPPQEKERLTAATGREPTLDEIAKSLDLPRQTVVFALDAISDPISLFEPIYTDSGESICVMDQVGDTKNTDERWLERLALSSAMGALNAREKKILSLRFYAGKTQMEVAGEIGISQAQVSRLEKQAIGKIRSSVFPS